MKFREKDIQLTTDGMGIVFYSPKTNTDIPEGYDFLNEEYSNPEDVAKHIKKGDVWWAFVQGVAEITYSSSERDIQMKTCWQNFLLRFAWALIFKTKSYV
ncbi:hypothetical protein MCJ35_03815 [Enterocloster sp. OA13]|uniref:hypothetical protein n=1 Tax=Enterocloster TaxID=2719313 RepID=UPI00046EAC00|nr:hypothetical protein [Lachnoclostridium pacaense]MCC2819796.1 hypothetical protein [Lachnoclostridium pacaense]MCH1948326.1 hypothetical protein [Enterocloster sp. OA13]